MNMVDTETLPLDVHRVPPGVLYTNGYIYINRYLPLDVHRVPPNTPLIALTDVAKSTDVHHRPGTVIGVNRFFRGVNRLF